MKRIKFDKDEAFFFGIAMFILLIDIIFWGMTVYFLVLTLGNASSENIGCTIFGLILSIVLYLIAPISIGEIKEHFPFYIVDKNIKEEWF